jgi:uncharacterized protein
MLVVQVEVVDPEPLQRRITGPPHILRFPVDAHPAAIGPVQVAELGGQDHLVPVSGDRPPDQLLVGEGSVHVGGVQQGDAEAERPLDGGDRLLLVGRPVRLAHHHAAQADGRDPQTLAAERALVHPAFLSDRSRVRPGRNHHNHQMDFDHLDREGYIRPEADLANVQPEYQGVPDTAAGLLADEFGPRLHSAYLYGSVVRGNAAPGRSDVDLLAVLVAAPVDEDRARAERVERALTQRFPVLFSAGVGLTHLQEVRSPAQRYGLQVFLRELAVCIWGQDLRPGLPRTKPSAAVAAGFHDDTHAAFARARETLMTSTDPEVIRRICRMTSRRMVQVAFAVVMARDEIWATVLEEQAAAVGAAFPQWAEAARRAAEQGRRPVADARVVEELLDTFGRWAEDALDEALREVSNIDS